MEEKEVLVKVEGVSKKFSKDLKTGLKYGLTDLFTNVLGGGKPDKLRPKEFWAVQDISFELRRGECLGLIGHNGAGKSTLLKMLNGLIRPDVGKITMKGRIGALIELGAGFNNILTGRENIYNNGAVLGLTKEEIDSKLEEIISFAELHEFIDMPVQHYSSGMKVRLGFAVAAQMNPDVLIIDEVLAVGDLGFVLKCFKTIDSILPNTAIVFVSHSMPMVSRICNHVILMDGGKSIFQGTAVSKAIDLYYGKFANSERTVVMDSDLVSLEKVEILNNRGDELMPILNWKDKLEIALTFNITGLKTYPQIKIFIFDKEQRSAGLLYYQYEEKQARDGDWRVVISHENLQFSKGVYNFSVVLFESYDSQPLYRINSAQNFQVVHDVDSWTPLLLEAQIDYENN
ncbi:ABC transporter ATP-binding protein [Gilvibacter sediminis]|uniref:ABC transporter ATP-binding protein n=1 Tax=Gilvibacter sediminis TaxID=379071 RepID=UPI00234FC333|nr:ABC transporter ATP-binding protein [Gilvibacter sediminis]MDC7999274.1 ABC transporter ATP-binding protein [Gilvibacter sediminis]